MPCVELVSLRFEDLEAAGFLSVVADNTGGRGVVLGSERAFGSVPPSTVIESSVSVNGLPIEQGDGTTSLAEQIRRVAWLAGHLAGRGIPLEAGAIVSAGAMTGPHWLGSADHVVVDFGPFGTVEVTFL
jgi:2-keto-4-pentenoate hydratase